MTESGTETLTLYECDNPACSLGTVGHPGHFTGGITAEQVNMLTGTPVEHLTEGTDFGEGVCTNCGKPGNAVGDHSYAEHAGTEPTEGENPVFARLKMLADEAGAEIVWSDKSNG